MLVHHHLEEMKVITFDSNCECHNLVNCELMFRDYVEMESCLKTAKHCDFKGSIYEEYGLALTSALSHACEDYALDSKLLLISYYTHCSIPVYCFIYSFHHSSI